LTRAVLRPRVQQPLSDPAMLCAALVKLHLLNEQTP
jgi:hypothetical protein